MNYKWSYEMIKIKEILVASVMVVMGSSTASAIITDGFIAFHEDGKNKRTNPVTIEPPLIVEKAPLPEIALIGHINRGLQFEQHKEDLGTLIKRSTYLNTMIVMPLLSLPFMGFHPETAPSKYFGPKLKYTMRCGLASALFLNAYFHHMAVTNYHGYENIHRNGRLVDLMGRKILAEVRKEIAENGISMHDMTQKRNANKD